MSALDNPNSPQAPSAAYNVPLESPIIADQTFYSRIGATTSRELVQSFILPVRSGRAWTVSKGHICRLTTPEGPQVGDLNIWSLHNPRERFWAARTRQLHRSHVTVYDRLWSCLPYLRPLVTITGDSLSDYGVDKVGGRVHDVCQSLPRLISTTPLLTTTSTPSFLAPVATLMVHSESQITEVRLTIAEHENRSQPDAVWRGI